MLVSGLTAVGAYGPPDVELHALNRSQMRQADLAKADVSTIPSAHGKGNIQFLDKSTEVSQNTDSVHKQT